jgi:hypothetical protein
MNKVKICPKCKQPTLRTALNVSGWLLPDYFECKNCGYMGSLYLEIDPDDLTPKNGELDTKRDNKPWTNY